MINENFFNEAERICWEKLQEFNNAYEVFNHIERTRGKWHSDSTGYTTNKLGEKRQFNIELKNRNQILLDNGVISGHSDNGGYTSNTLMIESHKVADLLLDAIDGLEPLYINFLMDGTTLIFNLSKLTKRPQKSDRQNIKSRGYDKFEMAKRQYLYIVDAAIYKDGKLIKKAGEEWNGR